MPAQRLVPLNGASFTNIRASIPCHMMRVFLDGTRNVALVYQLARDNFATTYTSDTGDILVQFGPGQQSILGRPPSYNASGVPANTAAATGDSGGGDIVMKVKASDASSPSVEVYESENGQEVK